MTDDELKRSEMGLGLREDTDVLLGADGTQIVAGAPVAVPKTPMAWMRQNLFSGPANTVISMVAGLFAAFVLYQVGRFVFVSGDWEIVRRFLRAYMLGSFPTEEAWRVWTCVYMVAALAGLTAGVSSSRLVWTRRRLVLAILIGIAAVGFLYFAVKTALVLILIAVAALEVVLFRALGNRLDYRKVRRPLIVAWSLSFPVVVIIVRYVGDGVAPRFWEGFFFNIIAATVGIFVSFPIGVLLAVGRRSSLPAVRLFSVGFIELFRGVPLVAWLIFSKYVVDLLLPPQMDPPDIIKGFMAMTFFSAAYIAEIVRGGLQGIEAGQYEAGRALGLSTPRMMALVILPQALRSTIPAMISHFISLFKDTSLFVAIAVTDLLAAARRSSNVPEFRGTTMEPLLFAALVFWIVAFSMGRWSQRLERRLGVGER